MPTAVIFSGSDDGWVFGESAVYLTARATATGATDNLAFQQVGQVLSGGTYGCHTNLLTFDTSIVPSSSSVDSASLFVASQDAAPAIPFTIEARLYSWTTPVDVTDYLAGASQAAQTLLCTLGAGILTGVMQLFKFAENLLAININKGGNTQMALCSDRHRSSTAPTAGISEIATLRASEEVGTDFDPRLLVIYTLAQAALGGGPLSNFALALEARTLTSP